MPLQKSYSEQRSFQGQRKPQWQRSKTVPAVPPPPPKPLPPVSDATKKKLKKYRFLPADDGTTESTSTGPPPPMPEAPPGRGGGAPSGVTVISIEDDSDKENRGSTAKPRKSQTKPPAASPAPKPVATPAGRKLAWQELIRMGECGSQKEEDQDDSPNDRILWDKPRDPEDAFISPLMPRRGKKRARSSSPLSSPATSKRETPVVDVEKLKRALQSPRVDPASDLWDRFSHGGADTPGGGGLTNPALAHLIVSSSPRPLKDKAAAPQSESGLRRVVSCGSVWPKRRRMDRSNVDSPTGILGHAVGQPDTKANMVTTLMEIVNEEIEKSNASQNRRLASKSPSPKKRRAPPTTPPARESGPGLIATKPSPDTAQEEPETGNAADPNDDAEFGDDDFGDDDFDDDTLMELDAGLQRAPAPEPCKVPEPEVSQTSQQALLEIADLDDEFGDMDDDLFAAADDLIAEIESKPTSQQVGKSNNHKSNNQEQQGPGRPQPREPLAKSKPEPRGGCDFELENRGAVAAEDDMYGDDFGGDFDFEAAELAATQSAAKQAAPAATASSISHPSQKPRAIQRYLVTNVISGSFADDRGREFPEKILVVQGESSSDIKTVHLRGDWMDTDVSVKSYVHIIGDFEWSGMCVIDNSQNMLILHPDQLISSTVVADSFSCTRRAVLQDRVKATSDASPALVYGTMLHEIFQDALMANKWDPKFLGATIDRHIGRHMEDLYTIKVPVQAAREHLLSKMREMRSWADSFVSAFPKSNAIVQGRHGDKVNMCVSKLLDVEEHVWSPMYGLKGNIDATVQVTMRDGDERRTLTVPFELKTGKNTNSNHQAQTALYNLLLSDRYDLEIVYGVLYYMETSQTLRIPTVRHELRHMIMQRNRLACSIRERKAQLPEMKRAKNACGKCYAQTACFIYHRLADGGDGETSGMGQEKFNEVVGHLTETHRDFFLKWEDLLTKEEKESQKLRRELWTMVSTEREKLGRCFSNVVIEEGSALEDTSMGSKINRFQYTFTKDSEFNGNSPAFSFLDSQLIVGEPIVVSDEQGHFALALGFVTAVRKHRITVAVDRRLHNARIRQPGFDEATNQVFAGIMAVDAEDQHTQSQALRELPRVRYRLDKDEFSNGMATVRNNLVQVMADGPFGSRDIRRLVVDLQPPEFKAVPTQYHISVKDGESLNVDQKRAIEKVMSARDYALVLGMPGTGKTTTIAHIIRALIRQGKSVLLTSYTHTAVDNILLKLKGDGIPTLRLGAPAKVHPEVREFATLAAQPMSSFEEIRSAWHDTPVVATTCLGINHPVFAERTFDYCIVDEASQITLPVCLGPIRMARTFVLVGDHNQLPPLVQNEDARKGGLDVSLFKLLSDAHPTSVVNLEHQYRMCEDIMTLSNTLIYNGRLKCGTEALRARSLHVPDPAALTRHHYDASSYSAHVSASAAAASADNHHHQPSCVMPPPKSYCAEWKTPSFSSSPSCWLGHLLDPETRVAFVNTDLLPSAREEAKGNRIVNPAEARLVAQVVDALLSVGVPAEEIGVMTHYRSQLALLRRCLTREVSAAHRGLAAAVEMHTADRFQGRDKEVVVLSLVRSNEARVIGELLRDWRRINVAFTRAKTKLLVIGSRETLRGCVGGVGGVGGAGKGADSVTEGEEMLSRFVRLMEDRDWVFDLPADALESHYFPGSGDDGTQATAPAGLTSSPIKRSSPKKRSPKKGRVLGVSRGHLVSGGNGGGGIGAGKENVAPPGSAEPRGPRRARIGERALLKGKPLLRDILNDMMDGSY